MFQKLEDLEVYRLAEDLADDIWTLVGEWDKFAKDTLGKQLVRSTDSISANLSEGFGRYSFKENVQFCYFARGSLTETKNWLRRAKKRNLLTQSQSEDFEKRMELLGKKLNAFITSIKKQYSKSNSIAVK